MVWLTEIVYRRYSKLLASSAIDVMIAWFSAPEMSSLKWTLARPRTELTVKLGLRLLKVLPLLQPRQILSEGHPGMMYFISSFFFLLFIRFALFLFCQQQFFHFLELRNGKTVKWSWWLVSRAAAKQPGSTSIWPKIRRKSTMSLEHHHWLTKWR